MEFPTDIVRFPRFSNPSPTSPPSPITLIAGPFAFKTTTSNTRTTNATTNRDGKFSRSISSVGQQSVFSQGAEEVEIYPNGTILEAPNTRIFTFAELKRATTNFKLDTVLGEGGFGWVFKGWVDKKMLNLATSGFDMVITVRKLNPESVWGLEEWQKLMPSAARTPHLSLPL